MCALDERIFIFPFELVISLLTLSTCCEMFRKCLDFVIRIVCICHILQSLVLKCKDRCMAAGTKCYNIEYASCCVLNVSLTWPQGF